MPEVDSVLPRSAVVMRALHLEAERLQHDDHLASRHLLSILRKRVEVTSSFGR
jgi:hypothetical protein